MEGVNRYYSNTERYPALVTAAWQWHPSNWYEASARARSLIWGPHDGLRLQALLRLALTEADLNAAAMASSSMFDYSCGDSRHFSRIPASIRGVLKLRDRSPPSSVGSSNIGSHLSGRRCLNDRG